MFIKATTTALLLVLVSSFNYGMQDWIKNLLMPVEKTSQEIQLAQMAQFIEGVIYGIVGEQFIDLEGCLKDAGTIQNDMYLAVQDFDEENFEGMR